MSEDAGTVYEILGVPFEVVSEPKCHVCTIDFRLGRRDLELRTRIDTLLVLGKTVYALLRDLEPEVQAHISLSSLKRHAARHIPQESAIFREAVERYAARMASAVDERGDTIFTYLGSLNALVESGGQKQALGQMSLTTGQWLRAVALLHSIERDYRAGDQRLQAARDAIVRIYDYGLQACSGDARRIEEFTDAVMNDPCLRVGVERRESDLYEDGVARSA
jgi:hypothetical protein